jgi:hypothetical protein
MLADLDSFYLTGMTGLALQLGCRRSDDFDFFRRCRKRTFTLDAFNRRRLEMGKYKEKE